MLKEIGIFYVTKCMECREKKDVWSFLLLENSRPLSLLREPQTPFSSLRTPDFFSTCLGIDSLNSTYNPFLTYNPWLAEGTFNKINQIRLLPCSKHFSGIYFTENDIQMSYHGQSRSYLPGSWLFLLLYPSTTL